MPLGGELPAEFDAGHAEIDASLLPKGVDQQGHSYFRCLPHWPFPFSSVCYLTDPLQGTGVSCRPECLIYAPRHFFLSHELSDVESSQVGGQTSRPRTLTLHLHIMRRHLVNDRAAPCVPTVRGMTNSYQGTSSSEMPWTAS